MCGSAAQVTTVIHRTKNILKQVVIRALAHPRVRTFFSPFTGCLRTVFMMHRIEDPAQGIYGHSIQFIESILQRLRRQNYRLVSLPELIADLNGDAPPKGHSVAFTFDDGTYDQAEIAAPLFRRYDCPATIFLITGFVDGSLWPWDDQIAYLFRHTTRTSVTIRTDSQTLSYDLRSDAQRLSAVEDLRLRCKAMAQPELLAVLDALPDAAELAIPERAPRAYAPMSWDDARSLERTGLFSFGPHSVSHQILTGMSSEHARGEITGSWQRMRHELAEPLPVFNFPSGLFGTREIEFLSDAGLSTFVTSDAGYVSLCNDRERRDFPRRLDRFVFPETLEDFLQYSTWIEWGKTLLRPGTRNS